VERRTIEIMVAGVGWCPAKWAEIVEGDTFRLFEETGEIVEVDGVTEFEAIKDSYQMGDGAWCVETKDED